MNQMFNQQQTQINGSTGLQGFVTNGVSFLGTIVQGLLWVSIIGGFGIVILGIFKLLKKKGHGGGENEVLRGIVFIAVGAIMGIAPIIYMATQNTLTGMGTGNTMMTPMMTTP